MLENNAPVMLKVTKTKFWESEVLSNNWYKEPQVSYGQDLRPIEWKDLPPGCFSTLKTALESSAQQRLEMRAYVEISQQEAKSLALHPLLLKRGWHAFLVRGVYSHLNGTAPTFGFYVKRSGRAIWVDHASWGHPPHHILKKPLIIVLDFQPQVVYATTGVTE